MWPAGIPNAKTAKTATPEALANTGCLVRAVGAKQKISCLITAKEQRRFMQSYGNILKVSLDSLKKREKKRPDKKAGGGGGSSVECGVQVEASFPTLAGVPASTSPT